MTDQMRDAGDSFSASSWIFVDFSIPLCVIFINLLVLGGDASDALLPYLFIQFGAVEHYEPPLPVEGELASLAFLPDGSLGQPRLIGQLGDGKEGLGPAGYLRGEVCEFRMGHGVLFFTWKYRSDGKCKFPRQASLVMVTMRFFQSQE